MPHLETTLTNPVQIFPVPINNFALPPLVSVFRKTAHFRYPKGTPLSHASRGFSAIIKNASTCKSSSETRTEVQERVERTGGKQNLWPRQTSIRLSPWPA